MQLAYPHHPRFFIHPPFLLYSACSRDVRFEPRGGRLPLSHSAQVLPWSPTTLPGQPILFSWKFFTPNKLATTCNVTHITIAHHIRSEISYSDTIHCRYHRTILHHQISRPRLNYDFHFWNPLSIYPLLRINLIPIHPTSDDPPWPFITTFILQCPWSTFSWSIISRSTILRFFSNPPLSPPLSPLSLSP